MKTFFTACSLLVSNPGFIEALKVEDTTADFSLVQKPAASTVTFPITFPEANLQKIEDLVKKWDILANQSTRV